jgi:hypothetical protein
MAVRLWPSSRDDWMERLIQLLEVLRRVMRLGC